MKLARVEYEFFDFETPSASASELARQIKLVFADAQPLFVSWTWRRQHGPESEPYTIDYSGQSFFSDQPAMVVDASESVGWAPHVGCELDVVHSPAMVSQFAHQVLEVRSRAGRMFVYSLGTDKIRASTESPRPPPPAAKAGLQ